VHTKDIILKPCPVAVRAGYPTATGISTSGLEHSGEGSQPCADFAILIEPVVANRIVSDRENHIV